MAVDLDDLSVLRCLLTKWLNIALTLQVCVFGFKGIAYFDALVIDLEEVAVFFLVIWRHLVNKYDDDDRPPTGPPRFAFHNPAHGSPQQCRPLWWRARPRESSRNALPSPGSPASRWSSLFDISLHDAFILRKGEIAPTTTILSVSDSTPSTLKAH